MVARPGAEQDARLAIALRSPPPRTASGIGEPARHGSRVGPQRARSERFDVFSSWTFRTLPFSERYSLPLSEVFESNTLASGHVEKNVFARGGLDESETLVSETLDRAFSHMIY